MKKILLIVLASIMVLGFAASAFAIHAEIPSETQAVVAKGGTQITLGGELRVRGWYTDNVGTAAISDVTTTTRWNDVDNDGTIDPDEAGTAVTSTSTFALPTMYLPSNQSVVSKDTYTSRIDTNDLSEHGITLVRSNVRTESNSDAWYDARVRLTLNAQVTPNTTGYVALESNSGTTVSDTYTWGTLNNKQSDLTILEAWILHTGSGLLGIPAGIKVGHMPLSLGEKQFLDLTKFGTDAIVVFADPIKGMHVGLLTAKTVEGSTNLNDDIDAYVALMTYKINDKNTIGANYTLIKGDNLVALVSNPALGITSLDGYSLKLHNFQAHAKGQVGPVSYRGEVDYQLGRVEGAGSVTDVEALAVFAELGVKVDPVSIFARYGYGSGDKGTESKIEEFQTVLGRDIHSSFIYEYIVDGAASSQLIPSGSTTSFRSRGLANTSMFNLGASVAPTKDLTVTLDGYYLRANAAYKGQKNVLSSWSGTANNTSHSLGYEVDLKLSYKIDKNLTYGVIAGVFKPGSYYRETYDMGEMGIKATTVKAAMHSLTLSF
ncbi:MAG: hypothetical protein A2X59_09890 [Nitrospirae bacterium GWC2_42_7]|nr:MAG: hypothetical protein A2X59_09890 [Nitrospirae bacterium GWC2_42_7]